MLTYAIDFGTSNSLLGASDGTNVFPSIPLDPYSADPTVMRTLLYFPNMDKVYYGAHALKEFTENTGEGRLIRSVKKHLPIRSFIGTYIEDRPVNLEDLIGFFLAEMRKRANEHFQMDVDRVVLGRPARFSDDDAEDVYAQSRLEIAAKKAGFHHIDFLPEPIAAANEFRKNLSASKVVLVGDFGGGTSDFTVMRMDRGPYKANDVLSIGGVAKAGDVLDGSVMRHRLVNYFGADVAFQIPFSSNVLKMPVHLMEKLCSPADISVLHKKDVREFLKNVEKWLSKPLDKEKMKHLFCLIDDQLGFPLFEQIEKAKRVLSDSDRSFLEFRYPGIDIHEEILRKEFDEYVKENVEKIMSSLDETVKNAGLKHSEIDVVCCTGGTAKVALIRDELARRFGYEKLQEHNRFHSVVQGLTERARELANLVK